MAAAASVSSTTPATTSSNEDSEIYTCANLLKYLDDQLQAQMDVNYEYTLLQRNLERSHNHSIELLDGVTRRINSIDKKWNEAIDGTINVRDQIIQEIEKNAKFAEHVKKSKKVQTENEMKQKIHLEYFGLIHGLGEVKELSESVDSFHAKTRFDERRLLELEAKIDEVQKLDKNISKTLQDELQIVEQIKHASRNEENMYGICELKTGYKQLLRHLGTSLDMLESLKSKGTSSPISTLSVEELDLLLNMLRNLVKMVKSEVGINKND